MPVRRRSPTCASTTSSRARPQAPVLVLSHSLGADLSMWDPQARGARARASACCATTRAATAAPRHRRAVDARRARERRAAACSTRSASRAPTSAACRSAAWSACGWARTPPPARQLVLCNTGARIGTAESWNARIEAVREGGMGASLGAIDRALVHRRRSARGRPTWSARARLMLEATPPEGYAAAARRCATRTCSARTSRAIRLPRW